MKSKNVWIRLLVLILLCGLMMGYFVGCDNSGSSSGGGGGSSKKSPEELRQDLRRDSFAGLFVYLGDEMEQMDKGFSSNEEGSLEVEVYPFGTRGIGDLDEMFETDIDSAETLMNAYWDLMKDTDEDVELRAKGKKNGNYYLHIVSGNNQAVVGFYYQNGDAWLVGAGFSDPHLKKDAIKYATLCEIDPDY